LDIPAEALAPKDYVKPDISVGNYYLEWDGQSYGIPQKEAQELKRFVAEIAPHLAAMYEAVGGAYKIMEGKAGAKEARRMEEMFAPQVLAARKRGGVVYNLQMKRDGATFISRSETIEKKSGLALSWNLGELVFDRSLKHL
jgi:hypothetical protein